MAMHFDRACRSVDQGTDYANRGRLTGAVGPEQRKEVTFVDGQVYTIERNKIIVIGFFSPLISSAFIYTCCRLLVVVLVDIQRIGAMAELPH
jgi:hypothetical protein